MDNRHVLQAKPNYCLPACVVMVEAWRGQALEQVVERQHEIFEDARVGSFCVLRTVADRVGKYAYFNSNDPVEIEIFVAHIKGGWAIATCFPGEFGALARPRGLESPHGRLPDGGMPHHAVCVVGVQHAAFEILDPWSYAAGQPLILDFKDFLKAWTGYALLAAPEA